MINKKKATGMFYKLMALMSLICSPLLSAEKNMLFIGNSFTMRHELPTLVDALLEEGEPESPVKTETLGYGGRNLFWHWELARSYNRLKVPTLSQEQWKSEIEEIQKLVDAPEYPSFFLDYQKTINKDPFFIKYYPWKTKIDQGRSPEDLSILKQAVQNHHKWMKIENKAEKFDYVVLQSWWDEASSPETGYLKYAKLFASLATEVGAKPVLYLTAPNNQNAEPGKKRGEKEQLTGTCRFVTEETKEWNAIVVPVPLAVMLAQDSDEPVAKTLTFRYVKDMHLNNTMAYLTACTFYAALTGKSPEGLKMNKTWENKFQTIHGQVVKEDNTIERISTNVDPDGGPLETVFDDETRLFLQRTAWNAVELYRSGNF